MSNEKFIIYKDDKVFVALPQEGYERDVNHKYVITTGKPITGFTGQAAQIITKSYFDKVMPKTMNEWKKDKKLYNIHWMNPNTNSITTSQKINYLTIAKELRDFGTFDCKKFNTSPLDCLWLDTSLDMSQNFHFFDEGKTDALFINDGIPKQQYGEKYPINPKLDREGHVFTTFQPSLIKRIISQRQALINNSDKALFSDWVLDLRSLINDSISLVDITLNQLYIKAEYAPEKNWTFDKEKLGAKNNRRLKDKLKWIKQISGNPLDIDGEISKFDNLRRIRNHLNHFDPPTLVLTLEEATTWLNDVLYVGQILIKIRQAINVSVSLLLIEFICQKEAVFNPEKAFSKRLPLGKAGYKSSIWPDTEKDS